MIFHYRFIALLIAISAHSLFGQNSWIIIPQVTNRDLNAVDFTQGKFVIVGDTGTSLSSSDGVHWESATTGTTNDFLGISYCMDRYIAVGTKGEIRLSANGFVWEKSNSGTTNWLTSVASGNGKVIAVGSGATILVSDDTGKTWIRPMISVDSKQNFWGVRYGHGKFIAVGTSGLIYSSTTGFTWTQERSGISLWLTSLTFANNQFVAAGAKGIILTSSDGQSWEIKNSDTTKAFWGIGNGQKQIVVVGSTKNGGLASISDDCISWKNEATVSSMTLFAVAGGNGKFITVGSKGMIATLQETSSSQWVKENVHRVHQLHFRNNRLTYSIFNETTGSISLMKLDGKKVFTYIIQGFGHVDIPMELSRGYYIATLFTRPTSKLVSSIPIIVK